MNFFSSAIFCSFLFFSQSSLAFNKNTRFYKNQVQKNVYFGPFYSQDKLKKNILIGWDLNNVVFTNIIGPAQFMKAAFERHGIVNGAVGIKNFLSLKKEMNRERRKKGLPPLDPEHLMYHLLRSYDPEKEACAYFLQSCIEGPDVVDMDIARIIYDFDQCGYKQAVLSNMFESNLIIQIDAVHKELVKSSLQVSNQDSSDNCYIFVPDNPKSACLRKLLSMLSNITTRVVPTEDNNWVHKREKEAYQLFLSLNKDSEDTLTVFIDDNRKNVEAAVAHGFDVGIVYTNAKNLRRILKVLGFFDDKTNQERLDLVVA